MSADKVFWTLKIALLPLKLVLNRVSPSRAGQLRDWLLSKQTSGVWVSRTRP